MMPLDTLAAPRVAPSIPGPLAMAVVEMDGRRMTPMEAARGAATLVAAAREHPHARLAWCLSGFDHDPRPLTAIPEARRFLAWFGIGLHRLDPEGRLIRGRMDVGLMEMLEVCVGVAATQRIAGRNKGKGRRYDA